ncbi:MAG TPA: O-methyltransferase [Alphaproteobacteria bacterium]|nr:O-methyltransferase [Alphaproteobacteria bacterium]
MNTLATAPVAALLDRLFAADEASRADLRARMAEIPAEQRAAMMSSKTDYVALYTSMKHAPLAVSRETGALLYMLARTMDARSVVEFGTSFGISTLHLAAALRDNGGGRIITSEFEPSKAERARANIAEAGLADLVEFREGDALETLARDLPDQIDLVLLDGAKGLYPEILALLEPRLRPGALILADNADWSEEYLAKVRSPAQGYLSVPFAEDVELSMRIG